MLEWWQVVAMMAAALGAREIVAKLIDKKSTNIADGKVKTETKASEVQILRDVLDEVREDSADKTKTIGELRGSVTALERRMTILEERERHQLTRAAVHEAWDQLSFAFILKHDPAHPPPPPLTTRELMEAQREESG